MSAAASLCDKLLRDSLTRGVTALEFVGAGSVPVVNQQLEGLWQPYAQFPAPSFAGVLRQLKLMAQLDPEQAQASGTIHIQHEGRDLAISLAARRTREGFEFLTLRFPAKPPADKAAG
jgi:hypothetical protein